MHLICIKCEILCPLKQYYVFLHPVKYLLTLLSCKIKTSDLKVNLRRKDMKEQTQRCAV